MILNTKLVILIAGAVLTILLGALVDSKAHPQAAPDPIPVTAPVSLSACGVLCGEDSPPANLTHRQHEALNSMTTVMPTPQTMIGQEASQHAQQMVTGQLAAPPVVPVRPAAPLRATANDPPQ